MKRLICALVASLHLAGCTTLTTLPYPQGRFDDGLVRPGDQVVLTTIRGEDRSRQERRLEVTSVTPEQICGKDECFAVEAVESVQRKEFSPGRTLGLVAGIVLLAAVMRSAHPIHGGFGGNTCWLCP